MPNRPKNSRDGSYAMETANRVKIVYHMIWGGMDGKNQSV
jgi:hypothetical protein